MPKVYCYLNQKMADQLEQIKADEGHESSSQVMKEMLALGMNAYLNNKENNMDDKEKQRLKKEEELQKQHTTYLLRLLGLSADIFRCVYDKNNIPDAPNSVEEQIAALKKKVDNFIDEYVEN